MRIAIVGWLMVSGEITLLNVLTAILLAWLLPKLSRRFMPAVSSAGSLLAINRLIWVVIGDIIKSNIIVARLVLGDPTQLRSVFVTVPVDTDHPLVINLLASIITMTRSSMPSGTSICPYVSSLNTPSRPPGVSSSTSPAKQPRT